MKILVLTKRQYMGKDLIDDEYGRFMEVPLALAARGHDVEGICLSYRARPEGEFLIAADRAKVRWTSVNVSTVPPLGLHRHWRTTLGAIRARRPDVIWACSDAFHVILGAMVNHVTGVPFTADLYDNFAGYGAARVPGVQALYRGALRRAAAISCISEPLHELLLESYRVGAVVQVLPNAANERLFRRRERSSCREEFRLPAAARIIGMAGAISPTRGIETLFTAFEHMVARDPDLHLVLAGPRSTGLTLPGHPNVHYLGNLEHSRIPILYGAMDAAVICNQSSAFGDYCFPQKYHEILACEVPVIAARVGALARLPGRPVNAFYTAGDPGSLEAAITRCLHDPGKPDMPIATWSERAAELEPLLLYAAGRV